MGETTVYCQYNNETDNLKQKLFSYIVGHDLLTLGAFTGLFIRTYDASC